MPKEVIARIFKTKLALRIWLCTVIPTLTVLFFIGFSLNSYFNKYTLTNSLNSAENESAYVASSFTDTYKDIILRLVLKTASTDFRTSFIRLLNCSSSDYTKVNNDLQNLFTEYTQMNDLIETVMIARTDRKERETLFFYSHYFHLMKDVKTADLGYDFSKNTGITILPSAARPFNRSSEVVTLVIPLQYKTAERLVLIPENNEDADAYMYIFLNSTAIKNYLELYCKDTYQGTLYLVNSAGQNMSLPSVSSVDRTAEEQGLPSDSSGKGTAEEQGLPSSIDELVKGEILASSADELTADQRLASSNDEMTESQSLTSTIQNAIGSNSNSIYRDSNHIYINQISDINLYLVNIIPHSFFTARSASTQTMLLWIALISVLVITGSCLIISRQVTGPLKKLMSSVHAIENSTYEGPAAIRTRDEVGQLNQSIYSMYNTIQQQFTIIKQDEKDKYNARMQLLTEQMNPHFLYNALEFINMEVLGHHPENASLMISSLGEYLRISLASGDSLLPISKEVKQVLAYINIMNYRFHNNIQVTTQISPELLSVNIIKCILQPLVENSLKHGFKIGSNIMSLLPVIDISMILDTKHLVLTVTDNGAGIDIPKATEIMQKGRLEGTAEKHLGLNNIYQRLMTHYEEVQIEFSSIPFYENKVIITLPAERFGV